MSYANCIVFYGWLEDDSKEIINSLLKKNCNSLFKKLTKDDKYNKNSIIKKINQELEKHKINLKFSIFEGGYSSNEFKCFLHFGQTKSITSANDDEIEDLSFSIKELKSFINESSKFCKEHPDIKNPKLIYLIVSDEK